MISPASRGDDAQAGIGHLPAAGHRGRGGRRQGRARSRWAAATSRSPARGRRCCAASTGDPERYQDTYWSRFEGRYFAGDGAKLDDDGYLWLLGRVDDVMNVSGHRISTTEVESALVDHPTVAEAAVVGADDPTTGQAIIAFVTLKAGATPDSEPRRGPARARRPASIGRFGRPKTIIFTDDLPKTRSGKIMRRLLTRRGRGPGPRRHDHAGRRLRGRRDQAAGRRRRPPRSRVQWPERMSTWDNYRWRTGSGRPGPGGRLRPRRGALRRGQPPALPRGAAAGTGTPSSRRAATTRSSTRSARLLELLDPSLAIVLLTARPFRVQPQTLAWLERYGLRWDLLVMRDFGDYSSARRFKQHSVAELRRVRLRPAAGASRTTGATWRCSGPRACPASTSTRATTTDAAGCDK